MIRAAMAASASLALAGCMMPASRMPTAAAMSAAPMAPQMAPAAPAQAPYAPPASAPPSYAPAPAISPANPSATTPPFPAPVYPAAAPAPAAATGIAGLQERRPDLCGAETYRSSVSQPGSTIPGLGITRSYRVVDYRGIEPQNYDPNRIVFRLDAAGNISNIDCG